MSDKPQGAPQIKVNRWRAFADWDERPLRLDKFAVEDAAAGFAAFSSPNDPKPGCEIANGKVKSMDGIAAADFDMIDLFIANHHLDLEVAPEAMAIPRRDRAHAGRHERAARQAGAPRPRHDAGQAGARWSRS
jgi:propanediol dehydratase large subunit